MKKWLGSALGMLLTIGMAGCATPTTTPAAQTAPAVQAAPAPAQPADFGLALKGNAESFVQRYQAAGHRTVDALTVTPEQVVQSNTDVEVTYIAQIKSRLAFAKPEEAPAVKGRMAYLNDHRTEMSSAAVKQAEGEIAGLRQTVQEYMDKPEDTNMRLKVTASVRTDGTADPDSVRVAVETFKAYEPAEQFIQHLPADAAAEKEAYDAMSRNYGAKQ